MKVKITLLVFLVFGLCFPLDVFSTVPQEQTPRSTPKFVLNPADAKAIQTVIVEHLSALANKDANLAFSYLAPQTQKLFGDAQTFLAAMEQEFPVLCRARETWFDEPVIIEGMVVEGITLIGLNHFPVRVIAIMVKIEDDTWKIDSVAMLNIHPKPILQHENMKKRFKNAL